MIKRLSQPQFVEMANEWFELANVNHFWIKWRFEVFLKHRSVAHRIGPRILDVGCGSGLVLQQLENLQRGYSLHGCDLNEAALSYSPHDRFDISLYDIYARHPSMTKRFDTVFLMDVVEHVSDDRGFLSAALDHVCPGGIVVMNVPAHQYLYSKYDEVAGHQRRYSRKMLKELLSDCKMKPLAISAWGASLWPLAVLRKLLLRNVTSDEVISKGFRPGNSFIESVLNGARQIELAIPASMLFGSSFLLIAERE